MVFYFNLLHIGLIFFHFIILFTICSSIIIFIFTIILIKRIKSILFPSPIGLLPEALRTKCGKCSNRQKEAALKVLKKLYSHYPAHYNDLRAKWDQSGEYHRKFEQYLQEEQFNSISNDFDKGNYKTSYTPTFLYKIFVSTLADQSAVNNYQPSKPSASFPAPQPTPIPQVQYY